MTASGPEAELLAVVRDWDAAMIRNDADEIGRYMAEDWILIGSDGRTIDRAAFLAVIESGELSHDVMESEDVQIRVLRQCGDRDGERRFGGEVSRPALSRGRTAIQHVHPRGLELALRSDPPIASGAARTKLTRPPQRF
jgi:hypothetical protein